MAQYFNHWLALGQKLSATHAEKLPKIFIVNWFRKDEAGKFIWPGFGDNARVLKWMFNRLQGKNETAQDTYLGAVPSYECLDWSGSEFKTEQFSAAMQICNVSWVKEAQSHKDFFQQFGGALPSEFLGLQEKLEISARNSQSI